MGKQKVKTPRNSAKLHSYLSLFSRHLGHVQDHLAGVSKQHASVPSFIGGVLWNPAEKDAFFHALSIYSRHRTDLIAGCIGTKNEVEVLEYLALLEEGSNLHQPEAPHRPELHFAHEVSDSWLSWEEQSAAQLQVNEDIWTAQSRTNLAHTQRQDDAETPQTMDTPFGGIKHLTYGHLFSLHSILKGDRNKQTGGGKETTLPMLNQDTPSPQSMSEVGSAPARNLLQTTSSTSELSSSDSLVSPQSDSGPGNEDQPTQLEDPSPRSRRRHQKRMHMRLRRAQVKGGEVDLTMNKLRTGPRKQPGKSTSGSGMQAGGSGGDGQATTPEKTADTALSGTPNSTSDGDLTGLVKTPVDELDGDDPPPTKTAAAARARYQSARSSLAHHDITAEKIVASGLDIFNHLKLGKLLKHFISGYDSDLARQSASIDVDTLCLLLEILKDFLVQVMSRVILVEEEHRRFRGTTKVWRKNADTAQQGMVDTSAIQFALKTMGITNENTTQYFADLLNEQCDPPSHYQTGYEDMDRLSDSHNILHQHPLHQDLCLPHYYDVHRPQPLLSTGESDDLMDAYTDERRLTLDLDEETILDKKDISADQRHERKLWEEVPKGFVERRPT